MKKLILILSLIFLFSCGSRKVERNKIQTKEVVKIDSTAKIVDKETIKIETKKNIENEDYYYEPIDNKSEFIVDGKVYKNVHIKHKKQKDYTNIAEVKTFDKKTDISVKKDIKGKSAVLLKVFHRKGLDTATKIGIIITAIGIIIAAGYLFFKLK
ncbi:hypothetical protein PHG11b_49 [Flavobacterium phage 11b]|uniref:hypothetical protein n=1 Tax=Flavobacterium phage 11b TaxID=294631 RepID=UPI000044414F|nr:hypothetical protein PHG11b_49 [Flavobacterium phage 11b]CAH56676.1 hypothetical protein PHG11b_49 [Flavobacterium phage 11b]